MKTMKKFLLLLIATIGLHSCINEDNTPKTALTFREVADGLNANPDINTQNKMINSQQEWISFLSQFTLNAIVEF